MFRSTLLALLGFSLVAVGCDDSAGGVNIWEAVQGRDAEAIKTFAAAGGDLNVRNWDGSTPLWVALTEKNRASYEALLKYGADPNVTMSGKRVVTHWAATEDDTWWLRLALEHGGDPNLVNVGGGQPNEGPPLRFAITSGNLDNVKLLVERGAEIDNPTRHDRYPCYPLMKALFRNDFDIVLYLLEAGADYRIAECSGVSFLDFMGQKLKLREKNEYMFALEENRNYFDAVRAWLEARGVDLGEN